MNTFPQETCSILNKLYVGHNFISGQVTFSNILYGISDQLIFEIMPNRQFLFSVDNAINFIIQTVYETKFQ